MSESDATNTEAENKDGDEEGGDEEGAQDFIPCPHEFSIRNCFRTWKFSASSAKCAQGLAMKIKMDKQDNKKNCANMRTHNVRVPGYSSFRSQIARCPATRRTRLPPLSCSLTRSAHSLR